MENDKTEATTRNMNLDANAYNQGYNTAMLGMDRIPPTDEVQKRRRKGLSHAINYRESWFKGFDDATATRAAQNQLKG